jgi:pilus assembly protein CpaB
MGEPVRNWRIVTALAAVVLAAAAGVLVWQYVDDADERARGDEAQVEILVAARAIPPGTDGGADGIFAVEEFPRRLVPEGAVAARDRADLGSLLAVTGIPEGVPIVRAAFAEQLRGGDAGLAVPEGKQAITISVDPTRGVAGFVRPGDSVNVLAVLDRGSLHAELGPGGDLTPVPTATKFLLAGVTVLAVDRTTVLGNHARATTDTNNDGRIDEQDEGDAAPQNLGLLTLEVTPRQAAQLAHAGAYSTLYLTLNPSGFAPEDFTDPGEVVEAVNLFDGAPATLQDVARRVLRERQTVSP